jgi:hypothetical protein
VDSKTPIKGSGEEIALTSDSYREDRVCNDCECCDHEGSQSYSVPSNKITITAASVHHHIRVLLNHSFSVFCQALLVFLVHCFYDNKALWFARCLRSSQYQRSDRLIV